MVLYKNEEGEEGKVSIHRCSGGPIRVLVEIGAERDEGAERGVLILLCRWLCYKIVTEDLVRERKVV